MACLALFLSGYKGPVVLHWHSDILKQKMLLKLYSPLQNWLLRRAKVIVGTTPVYVQESPFLENIQRKVISVPIGIDEMKPVPGRVAQIKERYAGKKIIFSLGRDLFCLSSIWKTEAFGIVQIEAMSCGKPVIAMNIPESGVSWVNINRFSGINVKPEDADALAEAITAVLTDECLYEELARGARRRYETMSESLFGSIGQF